MNNSKQFFPDNMIVGAQVDNYKKYLDKFVEEFMSIINNDTKVFSDIIKPLCSLKSWRLINREVRKACNIYVVEKKLMTCADFQNRFFYEGTMYLRTTYGAKAPWANGTPIPATKPASVAIKSATKSAVSADKADLQETSIKKPKGKGLDPNDPNDIVNIKILARIAEPAVA